MTKETRAVVARAIYDILEGPVANQDFSRQLRQWDHARELSDAALSALKPGTRFTVDGREVMVVPVEADEIVTDAIRRAWREARPPSICGMSIDAQWRAEFAREIAAYTAMLRACEERRDAG